MKRRFIITWLVLFALSIPLLISHFGRWQAAHAETATGPNMWGDPHVGIVLDTTSGMQPEIDQLTAAWQEVFAEDHGARTHCDPICPPLTATVHLGLFKDAAVYFGATTDYDQYGSWLASIDASGGGGCLDAALPGILETVREMPPGDFLDKNLLLVTDGAPQGKIQQYMYVLDRLQRRGVVLDAAMVGNLCGNGQQDELGMAYLTALSGGRLSRPVGAADNYTNTLINLHLLNINDVLATQFGTVSGDEIVEIPLEFDGTMTTLGVEETDPNANCPPWCCLTCTLQMSALENVTLAVAAGVQVELLTPGGTPVGSDTPGGFELGTDRRRFFGYLGCLTCPLSGPDPAPVLAAPSETWTVRISGNGAYAVNVVAESSVHLKYLGRPTVRAGTPVPVRAALRWDEVGPTQVAWSLVSPDGQQSQSIELFDDGNHGDGDAGDGIYGGMVMVPPGFWRLKTGGTLSDGSSFQRLDPAPIRARLWDVPAPDPSPGAPGSTQDILFVLSNEPATRGGETTTFDLAVFSEQGWAVTDTIPVSVTLAPGESMPITVTVNIPAGAQPGTLEETSLVVVPTDEIGQSATAVAETTVSYSLYLPVLLKP